MQKKIWLAVVVAVGSLAEMTWAAPPEVRFPAATAKIWKDAEATTGRIGYCKGWSLEDWSYFEQDNTGGFAIELPIIPAAHFDFRNTPKVPMLDSVADPGTPFGIKVDYAKGVKDEHLKQLAKFKSLQVLNLVGCSVTGTGLGDLADLKNLKILDLAQTPLTNEGLKEVAKLKSVRLLGLHLTDVGDEGLAALAGMDLERLNLRETKVTAAGMKSLAGMKNLKELIVPRLDDDFAQGVSAITSLERVTGSSREMTEVGLKALMSMKNLQALSLGDKFTDEELKLVTKMPQLKILSLDHCKVTDEGLKNLAGLAGLEELYFSHVNITDAALTTIMNFRSLKDLGLSQTDVTAKRIDMFHAKFPKLNISFHAKEKKNSKPLPADSSTAPG